jgi:hypothetical protein
VAWYRLKAELRRPARYVSIVVLVGLLGGAAMASLAGARRTQSAFARVLRADNSSDITVTYYGAGQFGATSRGAAAISAAASRLPEVRHLRSSAALQLVPLARDGSPRIAELSNVSGFGSVDGMFFDQDRTTAVGGRMADPSRADEFVATPDAAHQLRASVGDRIPVGLYSPSQMSDPGFGTPQVRPQRRFTLTLVGLVVPADDIVRDDVDRAATFVAFTPALTREALAEPGGYAGASLVAVQLRAQADVARFERDFIGLLPPGSVYNFHVVANTAARVNRAVKPEAIALAVFGVIAALTLLVVATQAATRLVRASGEELHVLRSLGAEPRLVALDPLLALVPAFILGTLVAAAVAAALSPLAPLGPVRPVDPARGLSIDWTVEGAGALVVIAVLTAAAVAVTTRAARATRAPSEDGLARPPSALATFASRSGLRPPAVVGVRFAFEPGPRRTAVPVRSALVGIAVAVALVTATLTFGNSLTTLVSRPHLYGWNWDYMLFAPDADIPPQARAELDRDPNVAAWAGADVNAIGNIDGLSVPLLVGDAHPRVGPPILSGRDLAGDDEIVLGPQTLRQLHKHVGGTVTFTYGTPASAPLYIPPTTLRIVGAATMPAIGQATSTGDHPSMGVGAVVSSGIEPAAFRAAVTDPNPTLDGPGLVFVRLARGATASSGHRDLQRIADMANNALATAGGGTVRVVSVLRPAEIVNYRSTGTTPAVLAVGVGAGAVMALGLTLSTSVRRRRRDLALLKTLGFTRGQLMETVAWQASAAAVVGVVVGLPLGIAAGRWLWTQFARDIAAVPQPAVPVTWVLVAAIAALGLANAAASVPARNAARTSAAAVLKAE